jgi:PiT family inorganic phosphate transporter
MTALVCIIALALAFDFINGFHDAANSIATVVSTRVLSPRLAVVWASFFNFVAFLVFSTHVAGNIAKGVDPHVVTLMLVASALVGATVWDLLTWWWGLPTSSSHALLGGLAGAAIAKAGVHSLDAPFFKKTALFIIVSPIVGALLGFGIMTLVKAAFGRYPQRMVDKSFRKMQLLSAALYSLGHGGNDAQKTMGIIAAALVAAHKLTIPAGEKAPHIPLWVVLLCHAAMGLGTLSGGWRIVKTMGMKIAKLQPVGGFSAESAGAATLALATFGGIPVSTTHTITGAIVGVGAARKVSAVRWNVANNIVTAWIITLPAAGLIAAAFYLLSGLIPQT